MYKENKKFWEELIAYFPQYDMGHIENDDGRNVTAVRNTLAITEELLDAPFSMCPLSYQGK
jgi:hypothetical protein